MHYTLAICMCVGLWNKFCYYIGYSVIINLCTGHGIEWNGKWNGTEISVWNMEDARMEWNGRFQKWNGRQSSMLPYQFHTRFRA